jgi:hypothetical protein
VSKQAHEEVLYLGWSTMGKYFVDPEVFTTAVDARLSSVMRFEYLSIVELCLTHKGFFKFFGLEVDPQL